VVLDDPDAQALLRWLRMLPTPFASGALELVCVCAGAVIAAHAGLLHQRHATTHHQHLDELRAVAPTCHVQDNRVFVQDAGIFTSAGMTTGIDLFLHRIAATGGAALAAQVAQTMVVALRRGPHDPELSPFLSYRQHMHPTVHRLQDAISQQPHWDWSLPRMADAAHTSTRHVARLFKLHAGIAPLEYLQRIRLATAQTALQAGYSVNKAAEIAGFSSDGQLRRSWHALGLHGSPQDQRPHRASA
jgi:transcriptional regulator GlxA family with amidase domain